MEQLKLSICVPCYEMNGKGLFFLKRLLDTISKQFINKTLYEVVISDHSQNEDLLEAVRMYESLVHIKYVRFEEKRGICSANLNNAIKHASGKFIKPLFQDDFLSSPEALQLMFSAVEKYENQNRWFAHTYIHYNEEQKAFFNVRKPTYNRKIIEGENTIGPPSVVLFLNDENYFDENLIWFMDTEFYHRLYQKYNEPVIFGNKGLVGNCIWEGQVTKTLITEEIINKENDYINQKYPR